MQKLEVKSIFSNILDDFKGQFSKIFPSLSEPDMTANRSHTMDNFYYDIELKASESVFSNICS